MGRRLHRDIGGGQQYRKVVEIRPRKAQPFELDDRRANGNPQLFGRNGRCGHAPKLEHLGFRDEAFGLHLLIIAFDKTH